MVLVLLVALLEKQQPPAAPGGEGPAAPSRHAPLPRAVAAARRGAGAGLPHRLISSHLRLSEIWTPAVGRCAGGGGGGARRPRRPSAQLYLIV